MARPKVVITGGAGYVGERLGCALATAGWQVLLLDLAPPPALADDPLPSLSFTVADVRDEAGGHASMSALLAPAACCRPAHAAVLGPPRRRSLAAARAAPLSATALAAHFKGASLVFHLASYGMSGGAQLQRRLVEAVNLGGTRAVLAAAVVAGVGRLVYLST